MITNLMTVIGGLAIALMMLHITLDVASRYILNSPIPGTISIVSYYYMVIAVFIPLAFAEQKNAHISVEVVTTRLPMWMQRHLERLSFLLSATVFRYLPFALGKKQKKTNLWRFRYTRQRCHSYLDHLLRAARWLRVNDAGGYLQISELLPGNKIRTGCFRSPS